MNKTQFIENISVMYYFKVSLIYYAMHIQQFFCTLCTQQVWADKQDDIHYRFRSSYTSCTFCAFEAYLVLNISVRFLGMSALKNKNLNALPQRSYIYTIHPFCAEYLEIYLVFRYNSFPIILRSVLQTGSVSFSLTME